jgi:hypothetical protein
MAYDYSENYRVLGWEDAEVRAGKFKALRLEYKRVVTGTSGWGVMGEEIKNLYWYAPDVKYFVKCQYSVDTQDQIPPSLPLQRENFPLFEKEGERGADTYKEKETS